MTTLDIAVDYIPPITPRKALLLEDDRHFAEFLREFMAKRHYLTTVVPNGADGVRETLKADFDVIICDMLMPKLPGDMFYMAVKHSKPHLCKRFIFITGYRSDARIQKFIADANSILLEKPFTVHQLYQALANVENRS